MSRNEKGQFISGQSGNPAGRPRGSRHKLSEAFIAALCADWIAHGGPLLARVRKLRPDVYLKVISAMLPKELESNPSPFDSLSDGELEEMIELVQKARDMAKQAESPSVKDGEAPALPQP
jgi:Family of unknown function (DUF5681)